MCNPNRKPTDGTLPIRFGTYNIRNGRTGGLEAALRGDVPGQYGPGHPPGDVTHRWRLHPQVGRLQSHCDGCAEPTPRRRRTFLPPHTPLRGGGGGEVRA